MNNFITKNSNCMLENVYKTHIVNGYRDSETYFKKFGTKEQFEMSKPYKYWIECFTSKIYKEELEKIIQKWKDDIILGYSTYMEEAINMEDDDEDVKDKLIKYNNEYDGTFEYICRQFDDGFYYPELDYRFVYDAINY